MRSHADGLHLVILTYRGATAVLTNSCARITMSSNYTIFIQVHLQPPRVAVQSEQNLQAWDSHLFAFHRKS